MGVPDTPEGRFELVALHLFLALESLHITDPAADDLRQRTIEIFVEDMDDCMREMGVGDLTIPKKVKRAAATFYDRATIYRRDLTAAEGSMLATSLGRSIFADAADREDASHALAHYVRAAPAALTVESFGDWVRTGAAARLLETSISTIRMTAT
jgi:cytochrome b pre-mRNA-processing protein 3